MSKKKVLMVHNFYQIGGGEHTVYKNEVEMLSKNGHEVIEYTRSNDELKISKLKLILLPFTTIWSFKTYFDIRRIIKNKKIDIVHCHNTFPLISPSAYYASISLKVPVIQTIHNFRLLCPSAIFYREGKICEDCLNKNNFQSALKYKCYRNSRIQTLIVILMLKIHRKLGTYNKINYIFLTEFNKNKFSKLININSDNVFVKPNFIEEKKDVIEIEKKEKKFLFVGRLDENKGIENILELWKYVPKDYKINVYGDGKLREYVIRMSNDYSNINYYGFMNQKIIKEDLKTSQGLVFPSLSYEGFPMTVIESFSIGVPVLSTNIGNGASIVEFSKGGVVFDVKDKNSFIKAFNEIIVNNKIYSKNCKIFFDSNLNEEGNYRKLVEIYEKAK